MCQSVAAQPLMHLFLQLFSLCSDIPQQCTRNLHIYTHARTHIYRPFFRNYPGEPVPEKSRLVLPFWYWLTWVVPEKGPLNGCVCVCKISTSTSLCSAFYGGWKRDTAHICCCMPCSLMPLLLGAQCLITTYLLQVHHAAVA